MPWVWTDELVARLEGADIDPARLGAWRARPVAVGVPDPPDDPGVLLEHPRVAALFEGMEDA